MALQKLKLLCKPFKTGLLKPGRSAIGEGLVITELVSAVVRQRMNSIDIFLKD
jgi:hypothetical protein